MTDAEGFAIIETKGTPFIVVAESEKQKAYVKVADGEEQSTSRFDVGGKDIQKGLKEVYGDQETPCISRLFWRTVTNVFRINIP